MLAFYLIMGYLCIYRKCNYEESKNQKNRVG